MTRSDETIRRCKPAQLTIGGASVHLEPVVTDDGQLNSLQSASQATEKGGYVLCAVEAIHGLDCAALAGAACTCGGQALLEQVVLA